MQVGLAAPQVGLSKQLVTVQIQRPQRSWRLKALPQTVLFNPRVEVLSRDPVEVIESCLSVPTMLGKVSRPGFIRVSFLDELGQERVLRASGVIAAVIQHECDHLQGTLFLDRMSPAQLRDTLAIKEEFEALHARRRVHMDTHGDWEYER